ncbi:MAG TPA: hypothetical protein VGO90_04675 [Chthoniobacteraceae bacterium]|nr:hypothetical protein [Chthoniobacteraceae bacterium]
MIYPLKLETALLITGLFLIALHALALWKARDVQEWLRAFPRSRTLGAVLLVIATAWSWYLIKTIDLGEFSNWRERLLVLIPVAAVLTYLYVEEFLAVRALGMVTLLAAEPLLEAAFLRPEASRLFLVTLVYVWIVFAMFWIGMPYTLRNQIAWVASSPKRWRAAAFAGLAYGALLLVLPATYGKAAL